MPIEKRPPRARQQASKPRETRDVVITGQFKKDMKRVQRGPYRATVRAELQNVVDLLASDVPLPAHLSDHPLGGNWKDHRDCHVRPDLVLIYRKSAAAKVAPSKQPEKPKLHLVRIGSHSELGL